MEYLASIFGAVSVLISLTIAYLSKNNRKKMEKQLEEYLALKESKKKHFQDKSIDLKLH